MGLMSAIEDATARFRAGEAEIARAFFSRPRPLEQHAFMLRIQVAREVRNLIEISRGELTAQVDRVDRDMTRDEIVAELREHYYETRHYAMLGNLLEGITGEHLDWKVLAQERETADWAAAGRREGQLKRERAAISPLHAAAASFNSGGGGSVAYGMIGLAGGVYEELMAETAKIILHDEMAHGEVLGGRNPLYALVTSEEDAEAALEVVRDYSALRLEGRNFQFGYPLSGERIEAIAGGDIEPIGLDALEAAYANAIDDEEWLDRYRSAPKPLLGATVLR